MLTSGFSRDVCVIGGGGHVGLPLALTFAEAGLRTVIYDINRDTVAKIRGGQMPFIEEGGQELLEHALMRGTLEVENSPALLSDCHFIVMIVGTPVDEHLNPSFTAIKRTVDSCAAHLRKGQIMILRSTVFPGISQHIQDYLGENDLGVQVAFCPERVAQGYSIREFKQLPQIISAFDPQVVEQVKQLFSRFTPEFIEMQPMEAELCKLMTNAWRYIQFATVNQFYMIATQHGLNFSRILHSCRHNYPRMAGMPGPGFAAGPCLVKDTMQLAAFSQNHFVLGHAAMLINEGLPTHLLAMAKQKNKNLSRMTSGILGMAFKSESDDPRDSLSYKLKKLLTLESKQVLCTDPYVRDSSLAPLERVLADADIIFIGTPHKMYRRLAIPPNKELVDVWDCVEARESLGGLIHEGVSDGVGGVHSGLPGAGAAPVGASGHRS
jgi:UDP-N-acetyl-D-mannosaminuronic acid dehydrogenase